ncbi:MAG: discoidin domain-containing protein [Chloroflexota bacterium]
MQKLVAFIIACLMIINTMIPAWSQAGTSPSINSTNSVVASENSVSSSLDAVSSIAAEPTSAFKIISTSFSILKGAIDFFTPGTSEVLGDAKRDIIAEMQSQHDDDLIDSVTGLTDAFAGVIDIPDKNQMRNLIVRSQVDVLPQLHRVIMNGDSSRAYSAATAYNTLVSIMIVMMQEVGYSQALIDDQLERAARANSTLLGAVECFSSSYPDDIRRTRTMLHYPIKGKITQHIRDGNPLENQVYQIVEASNRLILQAIPHFCPDKLLRDLTVKWIHDGPSYRMGCDGGGLGIGCIHSIIHYDPPIPGLKCVRILEWNDPHWEHWHNNYLCIDWDSGMRWSTNGPIAGMECIQWQEPRESAKTTWNDNYLCFRQWFAELYKLQWSSAGPIQGMNCTKIYEPKEPSKTTWNDNYFCYSFQNLAYGKKSWAWSTKGPGSESFRAFDYYFGSQWSSHNIDPGWIYVNLGSYYNFNRVRLDWGEAYGKKYGIYFWDVNARKWVSIYYTANGNGGIDDIWLNKTYNAQFVLMYGLERGTMEGYSLKEFEVYYHATNQHRNMASIELPSEVQDRQANQVGEPIQEQSHSEYFIFFPVISR